MGVHQVLGHHNIQSQSYEGGFLLFDQDTDGRCGKRILIDARLVNKFSTLINNDSKGSLVIHGIKQLKSRGGGVNSYSSTGKAHKHMDVIGHVMVTYEIHQSSPDDPYGGIRIIDIDLANFAGSSKPGFYHMREGVKGWETPKDSTTTIFTQKAAINGLSENFEHASQEMMPQMLELAYGPLDARGYDFFYQPKSLLHNGLRFRTPAQKQINIHVASQWLAQGLLKAQKKQQPVEWLIHGRGLWLFDSALDLLEGQKLDQHKILIAGIPRSYLAPKIDRMKRMGFQFHDDVVKFNSHDWNSVENRLDIQGRLYQTIESLGEGYEDRAGGLRHQARDDRLKALNSLVGASGSGVISGLIMGTAHPEALLPASAAATAYGLYAMTHKLRSLRNVAGNHRNNANLNPHMHPFKSPAQFNHHVEKAHGSEAKSFLAMLGFKTSRF
ncbi:hypothetical protein [Endozoicomonas arenosclerae]|uniref:hypothetical protein n=1 Tax=Endozoicomonas arenosclerae TaxID=1633495 RepID=UPI000783CDBD|nr:hypothetical protein [Endozoicomonas arenosclerae]